MNINEIPTLVEDEVRNEILFPFIDNSKDENLYVELGVFLGGNLARVADRVLKQNKNIQLVGIDNWEFMKNGLSNESMSAANINWNTNFEQVCKDNLSEYKFVQILSGDTNELYKQFDDESIDCIFIDALHTCYDYHVNEINIWLPKVKAGGYITGHDWPCGGIQNAVKDVFKDKEIFVCSSNGGYKVIK
jgi:hypothetical protein